MEAALATSWEPSADDPNVWVFTLREGVTFHGGEAFTAEDVVFSLNRAMTETSNFKELLTGVTEVRARMTTRSRSSPTGRTRFCPTT
jgi:peptide/nickel transport system substrate-binding protein